ncbi:MAG: hypothetical protein LBG43_04040 [Treponema sp.]|jgi:hypothetical protein|nr:hypothetical protein [Treponema sp.]
MRESQQETERAVRELRNKYEDASTGEILTEVDASLENGGRALAVEIKASPSVEDVKDHVNAWKPCGLAPTRIMASGIIWER